MPVLEPTPEEVLEMKKNELRQTIAMQKNKAEDRAFQLELAKINIQPDKIRAKYRRWEVTLNAPARFFAVLYAYKLEKKGMGVPQWLQDFILR